MGFAALSGCFYLLTIAIPLSSVAISEKKSLAAVGQKSYRGDQTKGDARHPAARNCNTKQEQFNLHPHTDCTSNEKLKAGAKTGKAVITVQTKFGAKASCTITVQKKKVTLKSITLNGKEQTIRKNKVTLKKGQKLTLTVSLNPITATEKVSFTSSSANVASVTKTGVVKAKKKGTCKITAKSSNGKKKSITINVK